MQIPIPIDRKPGYFDNTVRLFFGPDNARVMHFHCRGAVVLPQSGVEGAALMAGLDIESEHIWIFEETVFRDFRDSSDTVNIEGISLPNADGGYRFVKDWFDRYGCATYYLQEHDHIIKNSFNQIFWLEDKGLLPKQLFDIARVRLNEEKLRREHILYYLSTGRLWGSKDQHPFIFEHLDLMSKVPDTEELVGVKLISCLLASFEQQPFHKGDPHSPAQVYFHGEAIK